MFDLDDLRPHPRRIVCLTEETTETLYLLGEEDRIVGVSAYTVRPEAAREKPRVSAFVKANFAKILRCEPDLVLAFSDLQADITRELVRRGVSVFTFNQRGVREILEMILTLSRLVGVPGKGEALVNSLVEGLERLRSATASWSHRPRVWFEEWDDPLIGSIAWVEELLEIAGGQPCIPGLGAGQAASDRIVEPDRIPPAEPEVILASWCGKAVDLEAIRRRPGWDETPAVRAGRIHEVDPAIILQPGPAALTDGVRELHRLLEAAR